MKKLHALQQDMQNFLLLNQKAIFPHIQGPNSAFVTERLAIYTDAYHLRLQEILATDFPGLKALAGDELFAEITFEYLKLFPSKYPNARYIGCNLADFLTSYKRPELVQMAQFEWAIANAEDAADLKLLTQADLAALPETAWPEFCFKLHPAVQWIELQFNIPQIWQAVQAGEKPPHLSKTPATTWTIWRHDLVAYYHPHTPLELCFLRAVSQNKTFAEICSELSEYLPEEEVTQQAVGLIITFLNNQMFCCAD